jgi:ABC-2 type transport system permease protein
VTGGLLTGWRAVFAREFTGYFATPLATVFLVVFLVASNVFAFYVGDFFGRGRADLESFFQFHPWLFLLLAPALAMRLWAEERRSGTMELLLTLPVSTAGATLGKFLAAWAFVGVALLLTWPLWLTVNLLGRPDNGVIVASYLASWLMAGGYLAISGCLSATTRSQTSAFVASVMLCFLFLVAGLPMVTDFLQGWAPSSLIGFITSLSFLTHFSAITRGVLDLGDLLYFLALIIVWLVATVVVVDLKREGA